MDKIKKSNILILISTLLYFLAFCFNVNYPLVTILLLLFIGIINFTFFFKQENTLISIPGIFSIIWFFSLALSQLRLNINQIPFLARTWFILWITYFALISGYQYFSKRKFNIKSKNVNWNVDRLLNLIICLFLVVVLFFIIEWVVAGELPIFSNNPNSYLTFSISGLHYFVVSCILIPPASLIYIVKTKCKNKKELFLLLLMSLICFSIPILIVSRQLLLLEIIITFFVLIFLYPKLEFKLLVPIIAIALIAFALLSMGRNQNNDYLNFVFNSQNNYTAHYLDSSFQLTEKEMNIYNKLYGEFDNYTRIILNNLPMSIYQIYMYISFNFDNFNYTVASLNFMTFGIKTFYPIIALTGLRFIFPFVDHLSIENYLTTFNTAPICFSTFVDYREIGIIIYMFILGSISSKINIKKNDSPMGMIIYSLFCYSMMFSFFTNFFANVTIFFYFILIFVGSDFIKHPHRKIYNYFDRLLISKIENIWRFITNG